jgi:hypothetical protein
MKQTLSKKERSGKMELKQIEALSDEIQQSIFIEALMFNYGQLSKKFIELAIMVANFNGNDEDWYYIGGDEGVHLCDLVTGAFWHYTEYHQGYDSESFAALGALGNIFKPGMWCAPDEYDNSSESVCYEAMNTLAKNIGISARNSYEVSSQVF